MPFSIPTEWQYDPPENLVVGDGPYASALAFVLGSAIISLHQAKEGPASNNSRRYPRVFDNLKRIFLVVPEAMAAAQVLETHQDIWKCVDKLASGGEQHELAFFVILPPDFSDSYREALAAGLAVEKIDPETSGHAVWDRSGSLDELIKLIIRTRPMDYVPVRARRSADSRYTALKRLIDVARMGDPVRGIAAAKAVLSIFKGQEYNLDLFCRAPSHQNGNLLRSWLSDVVTVAVTREKWNVLKNRVGDWLASNVGESR